MASDASRGAGFPFQSNENDELAIATAILAAISVKGMIKKKNAKERGRNFGCRREMNGAQYSRPIGLLSTARTAHF